MKFIHHFSFVGGSRCSVQLPPLEVAAVGPDAHAGPLPHVEDRPAGAGASVGAGAGAGVGAGAGRMRSECSTLNFF